MSEDEREEQELLKLERAFAASAGKAFAAARQRALDAGESVLEAHGDSIYRVYPDGRREFVKHTAAPVKYERGAKFKIR